MGQRNRTRILIWGLILFFCASATVESAWWDKSSESKSKKEKKETKTSQPESQKSSDAQEEAAKNVAAPIAPQIPSIRDTRGFKPAVEAAQSLRLAKSADVSIVPNAKPLVVAAVPNVDTVGLDAASITQMQQDLEMLSGKYEELRLQQHEQLVALRAMSSQAKIHAQVLDDIKKGLPPSTPGTASGIAGLDALNLEKYRLIRERLESQRAAINDITDSQRKLSDAISTAKISKRTSPVPPGLGTLTQFKNIQNVKTAVSKAKEAMGKSAAAPASTKS